MRVKWNHYEKNDDKYSIIFDIFKENEDLIVFLMHEFIDSMKKSKRDLYV